MQTCIDIVNESFDNSNVSQKYKLVYTYKVAYKEAAVIDTDLVRFKNTAEGYMDSVHIFRNYFRADVCFLLINDNSGYGGISYLVEPLDSTYAFAVVRYNYASANNNYCFVHETGHIQQARHNFPRDSLMTPWPFGHGYCYNPGKWRTIMAYPAPTPCDSCTRIKYWSNPGVTYGGALMGNTDTCDNARVLDTTASTVLRYRVTTDTLAIDTVHIDSLEIGDIVAVSSITLKDGFWAKTGSNIQARLVPSGTPKIGGGKERVAKLNNDQLKPLLSINPNPSSNSLIIKYSIDSESSSRVNMSIYDMHGNLIKSLINNYKTRGYYSYNWDRRSTTGTKACEGFYICKLIYNNKIFIHKFLILK